MEKDLESGGGVTLRNSLARVHKTHYFHELSNVARHAPVIEILRTT